MRMNDGLKSGRRWLQFSLRGLLGVMVFFALGLGWIASERRKVWLEERAVEEIERLGGVALRVDEVAADVSGLLVSIRTPAWKRRLFGENYSRPVASVEFEPGIGAEAVALLGPLRKLTSLKLVGARIGDEEVTAILRHPELWELELSATDITDAGAERLGELPKLTVLRLDHTAITERTLDAFSGKTLRRVSIRDVDVSPEAAERFGAGLSSVLSFQYAPMPSLAHRLAAQRLIRMGVGVSTWQRASGEGRGGGQAEVDSVTNVTFAKLGRWRITPDDLDCMEDLENVRSLYLSDPVCGRPFLEKLAELDVTRGIEAYVVQLPESDSAFTPQTLQLLPRMKRLESLQLSFDQIRGDVLSCLPQIEGLKSLKLELSFSFKGEDDVALDGLRPVGECRGLERLTLRNLSVPEGALSVLADCPGLRRLALIDVDLANCGGAGGRELEWLRSLTICNSVRREVAPLGIVPVPKLEELVLHGVELSEEAIERLERCPKLRRLEISGIVFDEEEMKRLEALPGLEEFGYSSGEPVRGETVGIF